MKLILQGVLSGEDLERVRAGLAELMWAPGKRTAGPTARAVKENLQAPGDDARTRALERFVLEALHRHPLFEIAARPARITRLLFSRYEPGMAYGAHTDDALMGGAGDRVRTDLAFTLFLSEPSTYEGGALALDSALGEQEIRLAAGDAILYAAGAVHRVVPVTKGERLAVVGWVQSFVPDGAQREVLFDLANLRARLGAAGPEAGEVLLLDKTISNLLRMWARS